MGGVVGVAELGLRHLRLFRHQLIVLVVLHEGHAAPDAGFAIHEAPREEANLHPPVDQQVDVAADALRVDDAMGEHLDVHQLVLGVIEDIGQGACRTSSGSGPRLAWPGAASSRG